MMSVYGRECKLGWGYNEFLNLLMLLGKGPSNAMLINKNEFEFHAYTVSSSNIVSLVCFCR